MLAQARTTPRRACRFPKSFRPTCPPEARKLVTATGHMLNDSGQVEKVNDYLENTDPIIQKAKRGPELPAQERTRDQPVLGGEAAKGEVISADLLTSVMADEGFKRLLTREPIAPSRRSLAVMSASWGRGRAGARGVHQAQERRASLQARGGRHQERRRAPFSPVQDWQRTSGRRELHRRPSTSSGPMGSRMSTPTSSMRR